jgi:hypothetical protein
MPGGLAASRLREEDGFGVRTLLATVNGTKDPCLADRSGY